MATNNISKVGDFIANNKKPLFYIGGAIAIVVIGYAIVNKLKSGITGSFSDNAKGANPFVGLDYDPTKVTISDATANSYANQLFDAMKNGGTDENAIYNVFQKIQKKDDFIKVYNTFGKKSYVGYFTGGTPTKADSILGNYDDLDLVEWLRQELSVANLPTYNLVKKTVNNAGLAY
jgi:hypothetical protein